MSLQEIKNRFLRQVENREILTLFEHIPEVYFWIKDKEGRFMANNQAGIQRKTGCMTEADVIGKTDYDFFPREMADAFLKDDLQVMNSGETLVDRVELLVNENGTVDWYSTTKVPLYNRKGEVIGVAGTTRNLKKFSSSKKMYEDMAPIIDYMQENYREQIEVGALAETASLSISQFERRFKKFFNISPLKFIITLRIKAACKLLINTRDSIESIARKEGFYNAGAFTTQFKAQMNMLPKEYRKKYYRGN